MNSNKSDVHHTQRDCMKSCLHYRLPGTLMMLWSRLCRMQYRAGLERSPSCYIRSILQPVVVIVFGPWLRPRADTERLQPDHDAGGYSGAAQPHRRRDGDCTCDRHCSRTFPALGLQSRRLHWLCTIAAKRQYANNVYLFHCSQLHIVTKYSHL